MSKIYLDKDPTLQTLFLQESLKARGHYFGELDNWRGPATEDALEAAQIAVKATLEPKPTDTAEELPNRYRDISQRGRDLIQHFESSGPIKIGTPNEKFLTAYQDSVGVWTIGYGHTGLVHKDGTVKKGRKITLAVAEALFAYDMDVFEGAVLRNVKVPLNDDQFAALVSFAFNVGEGNLKGSTLLRLLNAGDYAGAAEQFLRWDKAGGQTLAGLTRRRKSERLLFLGKTPFIVA